MCLTCVKADFPISERILSAANVEEAKGNFRACVGCGRRELVVKNYEENVEKLSPSSVLSGCHNHNQQQSSRCVRRRTVSFNHECGACGHVVAEHSCSVLVDGHSREVDMTCMLCGTFEDIFNIDEVRPEAMTR
ncbi:protein Churchill-like [Convolutriloba macropyga]|uniref:protein Churchill-like n=1 Tax=Convolutriloba macropyga TaxID=536237 RepID=UPI003F51B499